MSEIVNINIQLLLQHNTAVPTTSATGPNCGYYLTAAAPEPEPSWREIINMFDIFRVVGSMEINS